MKAKSTKKILLALSGGIDSLVASWILKNQGWTVVAVHFVLPRFIGSRLIWQEDRQLISHVKALAKKNGLKLYIKKIKPIFQAKVIDYVVSTYQKQETPNPCFICNREVKFRELIKLANNLGIKKIATGHYAEISCQKINQKNIFLVKGAKDQKKDQSYFLAGLDSNTFKRVIFPLGGITKEETKKIAQKNNLLESSISESQNLCFLDQNLPSFLETFIPSNPGEIVDTSALPIGKHRGMHGFTIGQRKNLGVGGSGPYFVVKKDLTRNRLIVSNQKKDALLFSYRVTIDCSRLSALQLQFFGEFGQTGRSPLSLVARYHGAPAKIKKISFQKRKKIIFYLTTPLRAVSPGQIAVVYNSKKEALLAGPIIKSNNQ